MERMLPEDAHIQVERDGHVTIETLLDKLLQLSGRLHVSLTRVYDGKNILVNQFSSREEIIQVSCLIREVQLKVS